MVLHYNSTMSTPLQVTIVRAGNEVGTYELAEVIRLLGAGTLKPTDLYWHEGMVGWELVSKLDLSEGSRLPAEPEVKRQSDTKHFSSWLAGCGFFHSFFHSCFLGLIQYIFTAQNQVPSRTLRHYVLALFLSPFFSFPSSSLNLRSKLRPTPGG